MGVIEALGGNGVDVAFSQDDVIGAPDLNLVAILGVVQHRVAKFHGTDVGTDGHHRCPREPFANLRGGRDQNAAAGLSFAVGPIDLHQDPIIQHLDGKFVRCGVAIWVSHLRNASVCVMSSDTAPTVTPQRIAIRTADGLVLRGELTLPADPVGGVVLCHPHPLHGGNMFASVIDSLFNTLTAEGFACIRFNFRGVTGSDGRHEYGEGEQHDIVAATDHLVAALQEGGRAVPISVAGWSFGAEVSLAVTHPAFESWFCVAPPLTVLDASQWAASTDPRSVVLAVPEHDQFCNPDQAADRTASWDNTAITVVPSTDHFLQGRLAAVAELARQTLPRRD